MGQPAEIDNKWKLLIVDDEALVHDMVQINLRDMEYAGKNIHFLHAYSAKEAQQMICREKNIAVIILDVMMEKDNAGLSFVRFVREENNNNEVRILLHTGQPGIAPKREVSDQYGIDAYLDKNVADNEDCYVAVKLALRSYEERIKLKKAATKTDVDLLEEIAEIYTGLLSEPEGFTDYETTVQKVHAMVQLSQEILAAYALADMKRSVDQGTTKAERLSYRDYCALTQIYDLKVILMHTPLPEYKTEYIAITETLLKAAKHFSMIQILPEHHREKLFNSIQHYEMLA